MMRLWRWAASLLISAGIVQGAAAAKPALNYIVPVDQESVQGEPVPDALLADGSGVPFHLNRYLGFVVVLSFWSQDCGPCLKQMPYLDRLQGNYRGQKLVVLPVLEDSRGPAIAKALFAKYHYMYLKPFADPGERAAKALGVASLPTTFIIDRAGRAVARVEGDRVWDSEETMSRLNWLLVRP